MFKANVPNPQNLVHKSNVIITHIAHFGHLSSLLEQIIDINIGFFLITNFA
jgi:hypothetical protein